jgi:hypothetical protein
MSLTARNTAIPVRLVGASALLSALALVVYLEHWARDQASIPWHQQNYQRVLDAYQQVRYVPPRDGYAEQIARVCSYTLAWGQHTAPGLLAGATPQQEKVIVGAIIAHECGDDTPGSFTPPPPAPDRLGSTANWSNRR